MRADLDLRNPAGEEVGVAMAVLNEVQLELSVVLGTATMPIHQLLRMGRGAVIQLETAIDDDVVILANNLPVAKGAIVVNGSRIGVEVRALMTREDNAR
ncbi:MAG TPA: FliM/FliN family flagellar motor switch protein [Hyphomicrobiales bacterium]|nr:FliM/FliN family flagellar motor switch protein [Hyphomicrobiales bacterium]